MHRHVFEASEPRTVAADRINRAIREIYDQGRVSDVRAAIEFITSAVFTVSAVFLILIAL